MMEEYFIQKMKTNTVNLNRVYIPAVWTNFQIKPWFGQKKEEMQRALDDWCKDNPSEHGYFTVVQHDDGPALRLPLNTVVFGACSGDIPIPLIYQDTNNTLISIPQKRFKEKSKLCSFVGNITSNHVQPNVRHVMFERLKVNPLFTMIHSGGWTPNVNKHLQEVFIETTVDSKFALAPRGYGRSSFRFFECFQLGTIPVYIWNDICWLPFMDTIDYSKLCIYIHINEIGSLESKLLNIDEDQYNSMFAYYEEVKHLFELDGMSNHIISKVSSM
jgi:hypothetical protein